MCYSERKLLIPIYNLQNDNIDVCLFRLRRDWVLIPTTFRMMFTLTKSWVLIPTTFNIDVFSQIKDSYNFKNGDKSMNISVHLVRVVETGEDEADEVFVHELVVSLRADVHVRRPHRDVRMTVVPAQNLQSFMILS